MDSESENESIEAELNESFIQSRKQDESGREATANWGRTKYDYYFTDYVDKDYPSSLSRMEERLASIEQEEAQRIQRKLFSNLDHINPQLVVDFEENQEESSGEQPPTITTSKSKDIIGYLEERNKAILESKLQQNDSKSTKRKSVRFDHDQIASYQCEFDSDTQDDYADDDNEDDHEPDGRGQMIKDEPLEERKRRPINMSIKKNRGLTPYKKKEYRNPRVKHKLKYNKVMTKRRRLVKEAQTEFHRYSGESTGIKTSTVRSIKLC